MVSPMNAPLSGDAESIADAQSANRRQAEVFRRVLHERYCELDNRIAANYRLLTKFQNSQQYDDARRVRRMLRIEEHEHDEVQWLIRALDDRFPELRRTMGEAASRPDVRRRHAGGSAPLVRRLPHAR
jgi:hypothetical protein